MKEDSKKKLKDKDSKYFFILSQDIRAQQEYARIQDELEKKREQ